MSNASYAESILTKRFKNELNLKHTEALREAKYSHRVYGDHQLHESGELPPIGRYLDLSSDRRAWYEEVLFALDPVTIDGVTLTWSADAIQSLNIPAASDMYFRLDKDKLDFDTPPVACLTSVTTDWPSSESECELEPGEFSVLFMDSASPSESSYVEIGISDRNGDPYDNTVSRFWLNNTSQAKRAKKISDSVNGFILKSLNS